MGCLSGLSNPQIVTEFQNRTPKLVFCVVEKNNIKQAMKNRKEAQPSVD
jgi:hypothetical protein